MAAPRSEDYGPLAVVFALYTEPVMDFIIPKDVFYPVPKCDSSFMRIKFRTPAQIAALLRGVSATHLRYVIGASFRQVTPRPPTQSPHGTLREGRRAPDTGGTSNCLRGGGVFRQGEIAFFRLVLPDFFFAIWAISLAPSFFFREVLVPVYCMSGSVFMLVRTPNIFSCVSCVSQKIVLCPQCVSQKS